MSPITSTLSTTPTITWSTMYLIENTASTKETSTPATIAANRPATGWRVMDATTAEANAPASSCPSIATLITPTRSEITPLSAPKMSGALRPTAPTSRPGTGIVAPAAAHARKATRNISAKMLMSQSGVLRARNAMTAARAAITKSSTVTTTLTIGTASTSAGSWIRSLSVDSRNVVIPSRPNTMNRISPMTAKIPRAMAGFGFRTTAFSSTTGADDGIVALDERFATLTWSPPPSCR